MEGFNVKRITATGDVGTDGLVRVIGQVVLTGGADAATATVYDGTSTAGTLIAVVKAAINTTAHVTLNARLNNGNIHVVIGGTTPDCTVTYA